VVTNNGSPFVLTPDFVGTDFTLTFNVGSNGWVDIGSAGNVDPLAGLGLIVNGDRSASVSLTGSLAALQALVGAPGPVRYQLGSAQGLSLSLSLLFVDTGTGLMIAFLGWSMWRCAALWVRRRRLPRRRPAACS
jgi:hypothetical protein